MSTHRPVRLLLFAIMALTLVSLPAAIAAQGSGTATPAARTEAELLLQQASDRLADTETVRFQLEIEGETYIDGAQQIRLVSAQGDLARPDSVDVEFQVELLGTQTVSIRMISIGDKSWTTDLLTGQWAPSPEEFGYNPSILFDNQDGLGPVAGRLQNPEITGEEEIGGRNAQKVVGTVSEDVIEPMTSGTIQGDEITITLWLDVETHDILRLQIDEPDGVRDNPATWTMTLMGHNSDLTIEKPDLDE